MSATIFLDRSRYYLATEYPSKIRLAVAKLSHEEVWRRANDQSNSIGNLIVHLAGNIRHWIVAGIGGATSNRDRAAEFAMRGGPDADELLALLDAAIRDADEVIVAQTDADLIRECEIQGRNTTVLAAIYHVVEHFSMHTGQIVMLAKIYSPGSVRFYGDDPAGKAAPLWGGAEGIEGDKKP
ncbi:MAG: DinB family protein [Gemmatimonadaceae bacterium]